MPKVSSDTRRYGVGRDGEDRRRGGPLDKVYVRNGKLPVSQLVGHAAYYPFSMFTFARRFVWLLLCYARMPISTPTSVEIGAARADCADDGARRNALRALEDD